MIFTSQSSVYIGTIQLSVCILRHLQNIGTCLAYDNDDDNVCCVSRILDVNRFIIAESPLKVISSDAV